MSSDDVDKVIEGCIPSKTKKQTDWAVAVYKEWCGVRKESSLLATMSNNDIEEQLCRFVMEARRQDGDPYPPQTVYALITGLQRYLRAEGRRDISFLTKSDPTFSRLRLSLDARMKQLTSSGVGSVKKQAQPLTEEHEAALWDKGVFSTGTSEGLLYVVFFYNCKLFGLRGGDEHRNLMREQFTISYDEVGQYLRFIGRSSKNVQGGLQQRKVSSKDLKIYAKSAHGSRCIVEVFNLYFGYIPSEGRKPLKNDLHPKYGTQVIGRNKLAGLKVIVTLDFLPISIDFSSTSLAFTGFSSTLFGSKFNII